MPGAGRTLRASVRCWCVKRPRPGKRHRRGRLHQSGRHSSARVVVQRCASSRPSCAANPSVRRRDHEARHDPRPLSLFNLLAASLSVAVDRARHCLTPQKHRFRPRPTPSNAAESSSHRASLPLRYAMCLPDRRPQPDSSHPNPITIVAAPTVPEHSAVSSLEACTTPAHWALRCLVCPTVRAGIVQP